MTREEFIQTAVAMGMRGVENEKHRKEFVTHLLESAKAGADAIGLTDDNPSYHGSPNVLSSALAKSERRVRELEEENEKLRGELEQATAPTGKGRRP